MIDEIDISLHYQVQVNIGKLLLKIAKDLNLQIFATTHSYDCVSAFSEALRELGDNSFGKLYRVTRRGQNIIHAVDYHAEMLDIAIRQNIEVR